MKDKDTIYEYCGSGLGIPGLPHRLTRQEAKDLGQLETLEAALERGDYKQASAGKPVAESEE